MEAGHDVTCLYSRAEDARALSRAPTVIELVCLRRIISACSRPMIIGGTMRGERLHYPRWTGGAVRDRDVPGSIREPDAFHL